MNLLTNVCRGSSVSIVTRLQAGQPAFDSRQGLEYFSFRHCVQTGSGPHPASYPVETGVPSLGVKRPERGADNSHPCNAEVIMRGAIPPLPEAMDTSSWRCT
jgi:hypothetical protein